MYGYTVHTGSNEKFTKGWDSIFKNTEAAPKKAAPATKKAPAASKKRKKS